MKWSYHIGYLLNLLIKNKKQFYKPESLRQIAEKNINLNDNKLNKELNKKMINPYYFHGRLLQVGFNFTLESYHIYHANSKIFFF